MDLDQATINKAIELFKTTVMKHYMDFGGREARKDFWTYAIVILLVMLAVAVIAAILHLAILGPAVGLALLLPNLGITIRRLHDVGNNGNIAFALAGISAFANLVALLTLGSFYALLSFAAILPLIALVQLGLLAVILYLCAQSGSSESNAYGPVPQSFM